MINKKYLQTPKGTKDFAGDLAQKRIELIRFFQDQFRLFDFEPLITPNIEYKELVDAKSLATYGDEKKLMYSFKDLGGRDLILKYDQTLPLARFVAFDPTIALPYKRYAIGRAYRHENVQKGRSREFLQCDLDIVGSSSVKSDLFIIYSVLSISKKLNFNNAKIYFNDRRIISSILDYLDIDSSLYIKIIRELDKKDKIGLKDVQGNISDIIGSEKSKKLINILGTKATSTNQEKLESLKKYLSKQNFEDLTIFFEYAENYGIQKDIVFDLFLARGLDYYTSFVFELIDKKEDIGSLGGGGRYDQMISQLCGRDIPCTGFAFGFERIFNILSKDFIKSKKKKIFIASPKKDSKEIFKVSKKLFENNIINCFDFKNRSLSKQIKNALKKNFDYVLFCNLDEVSENKYRLKDLKNKTQKDYTLKEIISIINEE